MKAITIWQPWASLILVGAKPYEFRTWQAPSWVIGQRIAIHAGARRVKFSEVDDLVRRLEGNAGDNPCLHREPALTLLHRILAGLLPNAPRFAGIEPFTPPLSCIVATAVLGNPKRGDLCAAEFGHASNDSDREGTFNWGWPLTDVQPVLPHPEVRGAQGFWDWKAAA